MELMFPWVLYGGIILVTILVLFKWKKKDTYKKHIGFVIGKNFNYSKEVTSEKNDGVDTYSFVSVCCQAIKEQQQQIEQMKKEIKELKGGK